MSTERWREVEELFSALNALLEVLEGERRSLLAFDIESLDRWMSARTRCLDLVHRSAKPWGPHGCPWPQALGVPSVAEALGLLNEHEEPLSLTWSIELQLRCDRIVAAQRELSELSLSALHWVNQCLGEDEPFTHAHEAARVVSLHDATARKLGRRIQ